MSQIGPQLDAMFNTGGVNEFMHNFDASRGKVSSRFIPGTGTLPERVTMLPKSGIPRMQIVTCGESAAQYADAFASVWLEERTRPRPGDPSDPHIRFMNDLVSAVLQATEYQMMKQRLATTVADRRKKDDKKSAKRYRIHAISRRKP